MLPHVALGLFAGLRTSELERLDWAEIDLADKTVEIKAEKAKTRARGIVEPSDNLLEWLRPYTKRTGKIAPKSPDYHFGEVRKLAGIKEWHINAMRHSAASYHLAMHRNAALTANLLRHEHANLVCPLPGTREAQGCRNVLEHNADSRKSGTSGRAGGLRL